MFNRNLYTPVVTFTDQSNSTSNPSSLAFTNSNFWVAYQAFAPTSTAPHVPTTNLLQLSPTLELVQVRVMLGKVVWETGSESVCVCVWLLMALHVLHRLCVSCVCVFLRPAPSFLPSTCPFPLSPLTPNNNNKTGFPGGRQRDRAAVA